MSLINLCCVFNATKLTIQTVVHGPYVVQTWPQNGPRVLAHLRDWSGSVSSWNNRCFLQRTCFGPAEFLNMVPNLSQINSNVWMKYLICPNVSSDFPACSHPAAVFISQGEERRSRAGECGGNRSAAVASLPSTWPWNPIWELMKCLSMPDGQRRRVFAFLINQSLSLPRPPPPPPRSRCWCCRVNQQILPLNEPSFINGSSAFRADQVWESDECSGSWWSTGRTVCSGAPRGQEWNYGRSD